MHVGVLYQVVALVEPLAITPSSCNRVGQTILLQGGGLMTQTLVTDA